MIRGRVRQPLWLREPSRFAGLGRGRAIVVLGLLALLVIASLGALRDRVAPALAHGRAATQGDLVLYDEIIEGVRHGGDYYALAAEGLRSGGYPLRPFVAFRLPTLAVVAAWLPRQVMVGILYLLVIGVGLVWYARLHASLTHPVALGIAMLMLATGTMVFVQPGLIGFHEIWAGLLVALSLGLRRPGRWIEPVAFALIAMLVRETAALYVAVMGLFALLEGRRAETAGWAAVTALYAVVIAAHAAAVTQVLQPLDPVSPGWSGSLGFAFFVRSVMTSTGLSLLPDEIAAVLVALALFGWSALRDPLASRALAIFALYAVLLAVAARPDTFYWALMVAPTLLVGLAFVPDGLRDLVAAATDRRRITVTRLAR